MKCRACWAEKAYVRQVSGWKGWLMAGLLLVPLKCHHCYHKFTVHWLFTLGKRLTPPPLHVTPAEATVGRESPARNAPMSRNSNRPATVSRKAA